ncbi:hypothetical protein H2248_009968 [Termitomyces sp. 'cryptogamus']|nr:hypothetical protein H2248_009968 [Termitomyces sp. 'cryptogamus']
MAQKRKTDEGTADCRKRPRLASTSQKQPAQHMTPVAKRSVTTTEIPTQILDRNTSATLEAQTMRPDSRPQKKRRINKLVPPRPFPTVPSSVSATGPRSAHKEGKNLICITRKTALGAYLRRCKDVVLKDGYKTLHFSAMGAAIPHLLQLVVALPSILPFAADEIKTQVTTGTVEIQDEVIPDDDEEDFTYDTRGKSSLNVVFKIGDGEFEGDKSGVVKKNSKRRAGTNGGQEAKSTGNRDQGRGAQDSADIVLQEPEQEEIEML